MMKLLFGILLILLPLFLNGQNHKDAGLAGRLKSHVAILAADSLEGRGLGTEGKILAKNYIADQFGSAGLKPFEDDYFQHFDLRIGLARVPATNVIGYIPGADPVLKDEFIVIGAHYDHLGYEYLNDGRVIYNGADDNASGTAVVLELARYFSQNPDLAGRSIVFVAFDAEESGLLGSMHFIEQNEILDTEKIKVMFSLDMVGMYEANSGLELLGIGTLDGGDDLAGKISLSQDVRLKRTTANIPSRTDTRPFGNNGIPSIQVFTGLESPYHKPDDIYNLLDYEGMESITLYLQELISEISVVPELLPSGRFARMQRPYGLRFNAGVIAHTGGTHHKYPDEFFRANSVFAFSTGFLMQIHVGQRFAIQPEILYDYNGSKSVEGTYRRHSLTIPVNLQINLAGDESGLFRVYPFTGGYYRFNFAGEAGGIEMDFDNIHPFREWGINLGFGVEIMKINVAYTWRRGLTDISTVPGSKIFDNGQYFTVAYLF